MIVLFLKVLPIIVFIILVYVIIGIDKLMFGGE